MSNAIEPNQVILLLILTGAVILLFTEWIRIDLTAILIILLLSLTGVLEPEDALSGFSSEPTSWLANALVSSWGIHWVLLALFMVTGIATQVMSDAAPTATY